VPPRQPSELISLLLLLLLLSLLLKMTASAAGTAAAAAQWLGLTSQSLHGRMICHELIKRYGTEY